jgi:hypothetical protein
VAEYDSVIPAGGSGKLTAKIKTTATQMGSVSKSIALWTDSKGAERITLVMSFKAVPSVTVLPRVRVYLNGVQGEGISSTVTIRRHDGAPLEIEGVEIDDARLKATFSTAKEGGTIDQRTTIPGDVLLTVSVDPDAAVGNRNGKLGVRTNHPKAPLVEIPYVLRVRPIIEARPAQLRLVLEEGNRGGRMALFRIVHNRRSPFKLTGAVSSAPDVFDASLIKNDAPQQVHSVAVSLTDDLAPGDIEDRRVEALVLKTDDATQPEIAVPVVIEPRFPRKPRAPQPVP